MRNALAVVTVLLISCGGAAAPGPAAGPSDPVTPADTPTGKTEAPSPAGCTAADGGVDSSMVAQNERIGALHLGATADAVVAAAGKVGAVKGPMGNEVEGGFDWMWSYPDHGLQLMMHADEKDQAPSVSAIILGKGATLKTRAGVGVGSPVADVERAYGACLSDESTEESRIAGSVYGGVIFGIAGGVVESVFVGAAAE